MRTKQQCQKLLFNIGIRIGVSPKLISTRLLDDDDKKDMLESLLSDDVVELSVRLWHAAGMPDYAHGFTESYKQS